MIDIKKWRKLANASGVQQWKQQGWDVITDDKVCPTEICTADVVSDGAFIAYSNPENVVALLDAVDKLIYMITNFDPKQKINREELLEQIGLK